MYDGELIETNDGKYRRHMAKTIDRFIVGVDLGQSNDWTAISVLQHSTRALETWAVRHPKHHRNSYGSLEQEVETFFDLRVLERLPLHTPYPEQVARIEQIMAHPRMRGDAELVVDATGVGAPVVDMLETRSLRPIRVTISGGAEAVRHDEHRYSVPKADLIGAVLARLHAKELRLGAGLALLEPLREELNDFQLLGRSATGHETFGGRSGKHDDLVISLGLATWWATAKARRRGMMTAQHVRGLI